MGCKSIPVKRTINRESHRNPPPRQAGRGQSAVPGPSNPRGDEAVGNQDQEDDRERAEGPVGEVQAPPGQPRDPAQGQVEKVEQDRAVGLRREIVGEEGISIRACRIRPR